jgi:hypothetical protein
MALVASVLAAWREGRIDEVGDGIRAALVNAGHPLEPAPTPPSKAGPGAGRESGVSEAERAARALIAHHRDPVIAALATAILAASERLDQSSR